MACQICGQTNHTTIKCYCRYDYATNEDNAQKTIATMTINNQGDPNFYTDLIMCNGSHDKGKR